MFDDDDKKKREKTTIEILKSPDQYEGKDTALHMSEMEELVKNSSTMSELVVRSLNLVRIRLSFLDPCPDCYNPEFKKSKGRKFCCQKGEVEDKIRSMNIPEKLYGRRQEFGDSAQDSLQFFHNDIAGDLSVLDSRLVHILSAEPYNIIERRDYSVEKLMRRFVWEKLKVELEKVDVDELKEVYDPVKEIDLEEDELKPRVESLEQRVDELMDRGKNLKRPAPEDDGKLMEAVERQEGEDA